MAEPPLFAVPVPSAPGCGVVYVKGKKYDKHGVTRVEISVAKACFFHGVHTHINVHKHMCTHSTFTQTQTQMHANTDTDTEAHTRQMLWFLRTVC